MVEFNIQLGKELSMATSKTSSSQSQKPRVEERLRKLFASPATDSSASAKSLRETSRKQIAVAVSALLVSGSAAKKER